jgi:uncharacterized membrane protein
MPEADDMRRYQELVPDAPERFFQIVESQTVAPSKRYDKLVDAEIEEAKKGRISAVTLMVIFFGAAVVFFAVGNNIAGGLLLSVPVIGFLQSLLPSGRSSPKVRHASGSGKHDRGSDASKED